MRPADQKIPSFANFNLSWCKETGKQKGKYARKLKILNGQNIYFSQNFINFYTYPIIKARVHTFKPCHYTAFLKPHTFREILCIQSYEAI